MNGKILITSVRTGKGKESGKTYCSINYLLLSEDYLLDNEHAKGFVDLTSFTNNDIFNDIDIKNDMLKVLNCTFKRVEDFKNPLNTTLKLETLKLSSGKTINLL